MENINVMSNVTSISVNVRKALLSERDGKNADKESLR